MTRTITEHLGDYVKGKRASFSKNFAESGGAFEMRHSFLSSFRSYAFSNSLRTFLIQLRMMYASSQKLDRLLEGEKSIAMPIYVLPSLKPAHQWHAVFPMWPSQILQSWSKVVGTMLTEYEITTHCFISRLSLHRWVPRTPPPPE